MGFGVFECALATVTLQPINHLLYIRVIAYGDYRLYNSAIERCKGVNKPSTIILFVCIITTALVDRIEPL
jgi:hypothetical protein